MFEEPFWVFEGITCYKDTRSLIKIKKILNLNFLDPYLGLQVNGHIPNYSEHCLSSENQEIKV